MVLIHKQTARTVSLVVLERHRVGYNVFCCCCCCCFVLFLRKSRNITKKHDFKDVSKTTTTENRIWQIHDNIGKKGNPDLHGLKEIKYFKKRMVFDLNGISYFTFHINLSLVFYLHFSYFGLSCL